MGKEWILDVLTDLKTFAASNDLPDLERQLEETRRIARAEIASSAEAATRGFSGRDNVSQFDLGVCRTR